MTQAWYQVLSMSFGYLGAAIIVLIVILSLRKLMADSALWRRVSRSTPQSGAAGVLRVISSGSRRLPMGTEIQVPYEGTLGSSHSCDVCIPKRKVHMRSAFFWAEPGELHIVPLHKDGYFVDDEPVGPGDEAVLRGGTILRMGELRMELSMDRRGDIHMPAEPYVTSARRTKAQQGRGEGIGAPGKGEMRREKKLEKRQEKKDEQKKTAKAVKEKGRR